jgi:hypothetical protein
MVFLRVGWYACLVAAPLYAGTIDVSSQSSVVLHDGDALTFAISAWSYQVHAPEFGAPADPSYVSFSFVYGSAHWRLGPRFFTGVERWRNFSRDR